MGSDHPARRPEVYVRRVMVNTWASWNEAQTAEVLGCAVGTVKSTMSQALERLRADQSLAGLLERENR
ncbi:MAG: hypothetical protein ACRDRJ_29490 [Streptosporangiaceae bacterium]